MGREGDEERGGSSRSVTSVAFDAPGCDLPVSVAELHGEAPPAAHRPRARRGPVDGVLVAAVAAALSVVGWLAMFTNYLEFDDEGYMLVSLDEVARRGGLYDLVYSQYGPFYFLLFGLPARVLGLEWGMSAGRWVQLAIWVAIAVLAALIVRDLTGRLAFALLAEVSVFLLLESLTREPMHPGALLTLLLVGIVATHVLLRPRRPALADVVTGALLAAIVLTKINVGIFATMAVLFAVVESTPQLRGRSWLRSAAAAGVVAVGPLLVLTSGIVLWKVSLASVVAVAALGLVVGSRAAAAWSRDEPVATLPRLALGAGGLALVTIGATVATGTSLGALVRSVVIRPLGLAEHHTVALPIAGVAVLWLLAVPAWFVARRSPAIWAAITTGTGAAIGRALAAAALVLSALEAVSGSEMAMLPLCVLAIVPPTVDRRPATVRTSRLLLVSLAVLSALQVYPVAGTQISLGMMLPLLCAVVILADATREWATTDATVGGRRSAAAPTVFVVVFVAIVLGLRLPYLQGWIDRGRTNVPLDLPGTASVRVAPEQVESLTWVADTVRDRCDVVFAEGFNSFYRFSGKRPVTGYNATLWRILLDDREQQAIVDALRASPGPVCVIRPHSGVEESLPGPLVTYLQGPWTRLGGRGHFDVFVRSQP